MKHVYHISTPVIDIVCETNQSRVVKREKQRSKYGGGGGFQNVFDYLPNKRKLEQRRPASGKVVATREVVEYLNNDNTKTNSHQSRREAAGRYARSFGGSTQGGFPKPAVAMLRSGSPLGSPSFKANSNTSPTNTASPRHQHCPCCIAKRKAADLPQPNDNIIQRKRVLSSLSAPRKRNQNPKCNPTVAVHPVTHISEQTAKMNNKLIDSSLLLYSKKSENDFDKFEDSMKLVREVGCRDADHQQTVMLLADLIRAGQELKYRFHDPLRASISSSVDDCPEEELTAVASLRKLPKVRPVTAPPAAIREKPNKSTKHTKQPDKEQKKPAAAHFEASEEPDSSTGNVTLAKTVFRNVVKKVNTLRSVARIVENISASKDIKQKAAHKKAQMARLRKEKLDQQYAANLRLMGRVCEDKVKHAVEARKKAEINKIIPLQKIWLIFVLQTIAAGRFEEAADALKQKRLTARNKITAIQKLRVLFLPHVLSHRLKRARAVIRIKRLIQFWKMRRVRVFYKNSSDVITLFLEDVKRIQNVRTRITQYISGVRKAQSTIRKLISRRVAQLNLLVLQFRVCEEKLCKGQHTTVSSVVSVRREIRHFAIFKGIKCDNPVPRGFIDLPLAIMVPNNPSELEKQPEPQIAPKSKKKKGKSTPISTPVPVSNSFCSMEEGAGKQRREQCLEYLAKIGADRLPDNELEELSEKLNLIQKRPITSPEVCHKALVKIMHERSRNYSVELEKWVEKQRAVQREQRVVEAKRLLEGKLTNSNTAPVMRSPHFKLLLSSDECIKVVVECRLTCGLYVPPEYIHKKKGKRSMKPA